MSLKEDYNKLDLVKETIEAWLTEQDKQYKKMVYGKIKSCIKSAFQITPSLSRRGETGEKAEIILEAMGIPKPEPDRWEGEGRIDGGCIGTNVHVEGLPTEFKDRERVKVTIEKIKDNNEQA